MHWLAIVGGNERGNDREVFGEFYVYKQVYILMIMIRIAIMIKIMMLIRMNNSNNNDICTDRDEGGTDIYMHIYVCTHLTKYPDKDNLDLSYPSEIAID